MTKTDYQSFSLPANRKSKILKNPISNQTKNVGFFNVRFFADFWSSELIWFEIWLSSFRLKLSILADFLSSLPITFRGLLFFRCPLIQGDQKINYARLSKLLVATVYTVQTTELIISYYWSVFLFRNIKSNPNGLKSLQS